MASVVALFSFVAVLCCCFFTEAFIPSVWLQRFSGAWNSRDHKMITELGLSQNLWEFAQDHQEYLKPGSKRTGDVIDYFMMANELSEAIKTIKSSNAEVDDKLGKVSAAHFDAEQFKAGYERLSQLKSQLITSLIKARKYEHARKLAGQFLHTLQDFYSHSNWIELGNVVPFSSIDQGGGEVPIAGNQEVTCTDCTAVGITGGIITDDCHNNLVTGKLTSGYYGGQDVSKPVKAGKCSHGGILDTTRKQTAKGGINKDATTRHWSPHHRLHEAASDVAIAATKQFFDDIRTAVGDDTYAIFLNLPKTLALVIDVSGSMADEIEEVKKVSINFVREVTNDRGKSPFLFVLVPFEDPGVGPVTKTSDPEEVIKAVNRLSANGGGDCPELAMTALKLALLNCLPGSTLYFFSDAGFKDRYLIPEVLFLAIKKRVLINFILTGSCSGRRRRRESVHDFFVRGKRSITNTDVFDKLASQTGGQVIQTSKGGVAVASEIIKLSTSDNSSSSDITILNVRERSAQSVTDRIYTVRVDKTLTQMVIKFTVGSSPVARVKNSEGGQTVDTKVIHTSNRLLVLELTHLTAGELQITVSCSGPYSLHVSAKSPVDFTYQLMLAENNNTGAIRTIEGNPVKGQQLLLSMEVKGISVIQAIDNVTLIDEEGRGIETFSVLRGRGLYSDSFFSTFTPSATFRIQVSGHDNEGNIFVRVKPTLYVLGDVQLSRWNEENSSLDAIFPGELHQIPIKLENTGPRRKLYFKSTDDKGFVRNITPNNVTLESKSFAVAKLYLQVPQNASYGETTTTTIYVSETPSNELALNFLVFYLTVASKNPDLSPPTCTVLSTSGSCGHVLKTPLCTTSTWTANVSLSDREQGVVSVVARGLGNGSLAVEPFVKGKENNYVTASYTSTCCHPRVTIVGLDKVGNMGKCQISIIPDVVNLKGEVHNVSELVLVPGETTEMPFRITNLGTRGSYLLTAHVTPSNGTISYVSPLSFVIEANRSRECQLIAMIQQGDVCNLRTVAVSAVLQSGSSDKRSNIQRSVALFNMTARVVPKVPEGSFGSKALSVCVEKKAVSINSGNTVRVNFNVTSFAVANTFKLKGDVGSYLTTNIEPRSIYLANKETKMCSVWISAKKTTSSRVSSVVVKAATEANQSEDETELFILSVKIVATSRWSTAHIAGVSVGVACALVFISVLFAVWYCRYSKRTPKQVTESRLELA